MVKKDLFISFIIIIKIYTIKFKILENVFIRIKTVLNCVRIIKNSTNIV